MEQIFLYQNWLQQQLNEFLHSPQPLQLQGRKIAIAQSQYGAAMLQAYLGKASMAWIAELSGIPVHRLRQWRQEPKFLLVMDWSKSIFCNVFQEKLILNDYSVPQYHYIAAEMSLLEESLRVSARLPLYKRFSKLGRRLISRHQNDLALDNYDLRLFRRLFIFFLALEHHWPSPARYPINEDFLPLAEGVVWPLLKQKSWLGPALESLQQTVPLSKIRLLLAQALRKTFEPLPEALGSEIGNIK